MDPALGLLFQENTPKIISKIARIRAILLIILFKLNLLFNDLESLCRDR